MAIDNSLDNRPSDLPCALQGPPGVAQFIVRAVVNGGILGRAQSKRVRTITQIDAELTPLVAAHTGATALMTIPEVGLVCAASLVAELGTPEGYESPRQVLKLAGMNLAGRESGTSMRSRIKQTKRGRPLLRRQLFLLGGRWCRTGAPYHAAFLAMAKRNGGSKISAICALARRMVPMLLHIMQTGEAFDRTRWDRARIDPTLVRGQAA